MRRCYGSGRLIVRIVATAPETHKTSKASGMNTNKKVTIKGILQVLKESFVSSGEDKATKLSGSLAYSTIFSFAPLLIVIISLCGLFLGREAIEGTIYQQLKGFLGAESAAQLQSIIKNVAISGNSKTAIVIGSITLLIGATAIFSEIQDSINGIWGIKPRPKRGWLQFLKNRFISFSLIVGLGFLLLVSLGINGLIDGFNAKLQIWFPQVSIAIFYIINIVMTALIVTFIFAVIFKVLPDAAIKWKDVSTGPLQQLCCLCWVNSASLFISAKVTWGVHSEPQVPWLYYWCGYTILLSFYILGPNSPKHGH